MFCLKKLSAPSVAIAAVAALGASCSPKPAEVSPDSVMTDSGPALAFAASDAGLQWGACPSLMPAGCEIAVLHGDPAKPNADIFLRIPGGAEIAAHTHTSEERMILVSGELEVTYKGQEPTRLTAGSYAYGPAKLAHKGTCVSAGPCVLFIAFELPVDAHPYEETF